MPQITPLFITGRKRSLGQGDVSTHVCHSVQLGGGGGGWTPSMHHRSHDQGACIWRGGWLPRMHYRSHDKHSASLQRGRVYLQGGLPTEAGWVDPPLTGTRKVGGTHPSGMLSCLEYIDNIFSPYPLLPLLKFSTMAMVQNE